MFACVSSCFRVSVGPSMCVSETVFFCDNLQYLSIDFRQTFVIAASWDKDELIGPSQSAWTIGLLLLAAIHDINHSHVCIH